MCKEKHDRCTFLRRITVKHLADRESAAPFIQFDSPPLLLEENERRKLIILAYIIRAAVEDDYQIC